MSFFGPTKLEYVRDMKYLVYPLSELPVDIKREILQKEKSQKVFKLGTNAFKSVQVPKMDYAGKEYQVSMMKFFNHLDTMFPKIVELYLKQDNNEDYVWVLYELHSPDDTNIVLQFCFVDMFYNTATFVCAPENAEMEQFLKRNASSLYKFVQNSKKFDSSRYRQECVDINPGFTILSVPVRIDGIDRFGKIGTDEVFNHACRFANLVLKEHGRLTKVVTQRVGMIRLNEGSSDHNSLFFYDDMKPFISNVSDIPDKDKNQLLNDSFVENGYFLFPDQQHFEEEIPEVEEHLQLLSNDYNPYEEQVVFTYYIIHWQDGKEEWACQLENAAFNWLWEEYDDYELEAKIPTAYKAIMNGRKGKFDKGALIETRTVTFFKYEYEGVLSVEKKEEICDNCMETIKRICEELAIFFNYLKMKQKRESGKRDERNQEYMGRMMIFQALHNLF